MPRRSYPSASVSARFIKLQRESLTPTIAAPQQARA
jgi:hypothetical protein